VGDGKRRKVWSNRVLELILYSLLVFIKDKKRKVFNLKKKVDDKF